jgi:hypothetical protein
MFTRLASKSRKTALHFEGQSRAETHLARQCDVNYLYNRLVGGDTSVLKTGGVYADISEMPDTLQGVLNTQISGRRAYEALPDSVRARYRTAEEFYSAAMNPSNREEFEALGILQKSTPVDTPTTVSSEKTQPLSSGEPAQSNT